MSGLNQTKHDGTTLSLSNIQHTGPPTAMGEADQWGTLPRSSERPLSKLFRRGSKSKLAPIADTREYKRTKARVQEATASVARAASTVAHDVVSTGSDLLQLAPIPALNIASSVLLSIWEAVELIETNRAACLRLAERCAELLIAIRAEVHRADSVAAELNQPLEKLKDVFEEVHAFLVRQTRRSFLQRYLKRDEVQRDISNCESSIDDALSLFHITIQIRTLSIVQESESRRVEDTKLLMSSTTTSSPSVSVTAGLSACDEVALLLTSATAEKLANPAKIRDMLSGFRHAQDIRDRETDLADLRRLLSTALQEKDDMAMLEVLQIGRDEMPEAIRMLQQILSGLDEGVHPTNRRPDSTTTTAYTGLYPFARVHSPSIRIGVRTPSPLALDTLDRDFITASIDALTRLSLEDDAGTSSWIIRPKEIVIYERISDKVFKGQCRGRAVVIKTFARDKPDGLTADEIDRWKHLCHPNVIELLGASSNRGQPPWFLVSPYLARGDLVQWLKSQPESLSLVRSWGMMYDIARGLSYLHENHVSHGSLKASNVLVADDEHCVLYNFQQTHGPASSVQPLRWQSPEVMLGTVTDLTTQADIYAYGILCVEILDGGIPWLSALDDDTILHFICNENRRPHVPHAGYPAYDIIEAAWMREPALRPSSQKICEIWKRYDWGSGFKFDNIQTPLARRANQVFEQSIPSPHSMTGRSRPQHPVALSDPIFLSEETHPQVPRDKYEPRGLTETVKQRRHDRVRRRANEHHLDQTGRHSRVGDLAEGGSDHASDTSTEDI
ncbi:kinase-like protein [Peniophora sp. CONT]|nr:kinase-like protein [Peniophora sp. CONT]